MKSHRDEAFWADYYSRLEERGREADREDAGLLLRMLQTWFPLEGAEDSDERHEPNGGTEVGRKGAR